jgi:DUF1680 family protein
MSLQVDRAASFAVMLRIPAWAGNKTRVAVNGRAVEGDVKPGTFFPVERTWKNGDRIEVSFDMPMTLEAVDPQHPNTVALLRGPLTLFAIGDDRSVRRGLSCWRRVSRLPTRTRGGSRGRVASMF